MFGWILLGILVAAALYAVGIYNRLISLRNRFKNAFAQIDVQLRRRHDLIPNLVETAKGYMKHERETLENVIKARNSAVNGLENAKADPSDPNAMRELSGAESGLSAALGRLFGACKSICVTAFLTGQL
jgi:LemA protein